MSTSQCGTVNTGQSKSVFGGQLKTILKHHPDVSMCLIMLSEIFRNLAINIIPTIVAFVVQLLPVDMPCTNSRIQKRC